jgi:hypothetical protein
MDKKIFLTLVLLLGTMFTLKSARDAHRYSVLANNARLAHARNQNQHADALANADPSTVQTPLLHASFRPLNFALLRGGFSSVDEFFERVHDDPVLHSFYGECADRSASMHALPEDITAFSTFRKGDKIKWSQKPLLIKKGEYVLTFCGKTVLARCGNLISFAPMQPSEDVPPAVLEAPSEPVETPLMLEASAAAPAPAPAPIGAAAVPTAAANSHRFFFIPPFYVPPGGSHKNPAPPTVVVPPPSTVVPPPTTGVPPPGTPPPSGGTPPPPPPITTAPPPPPSGPPAPPAGHISGDEFSGHQALFTLLIGLFVIALLKLTTR